jgi:hypothetical protein
MAPRTLWVVPVALVLVALVPLATAHTAAPLSGSGVTATVPSPVHGTVTKCSSTIDCIYAFKTSAGTGWANSTGSSASTEQMALQLPGEAKASYHLAYSTYIAKLTGTYTYWTVGSFVGTDVNSGHVVYGTTNTNYTITCIGHSGRGGGCNYTYTTDNGTIVVKFTNAQITSTSLTCSTTTTYPGGKVHCTVKVTDGWNASNIPNGTVKISDGATGALSDKGSCTLSSGKCTFTYYPSDNTCGTVVLTASFVGNTAFYKSSASLSISVVVSGGC